MVSVDALIAFFERHPRLLVLTGAGCSTDSGDSRLPRHQRRLEARAARDLPGVRRQPADTPALLGPQHRRLPQDARRATECRTPGTGSTGSTGTHRHAGAAQNVDGLHQSAGSRNVVDLHGRIDMVRCLACGARVPRDTFQDALTRRNPSFADLDALGAPDGDADLDHIPL